MSTLHPTTVRPRKVDPTTGGRETSGLRRLFTAAVRWVRGVGAALPTVRPFIGPDAEPSDRRPGEVRLLLHGRVVTIRRRDPRKD